LKRCAGNLNELQEIVLNSAKTSADTAKLTYRTALIMIFSITAIGLFLGLFLSQFISRGITRPIAGTVAVLHKISRGSWATVLTKNVMTRSVKWPRP